MLNNILTSLFTPKMPKGYTGRHRATRGLLGLLLRLVLIRRTA